MPRRNAKIPRQAGQHNTQRTGKSMRLLTAYMAKQGGQANARDIAARFGSTLQSARLRLRKATAFGLVEELEELDFKLTADGAQLGEQVLAETRQP
jgi:predicted transcriptional regulator